MERFICTSMASIYAVAEQDMQSLSPKILCQEVEHQSPSSSVTGDVSMRQEVNLGVVGGNALAAGQV